MYAFCATHEGGRYVKTKSLGVSSKATLDWTKPSDDSKLGSRAQRILPGHCAKLTGIRSKFRLLKVSMTVPLRDDKEIEEPVIAAIRSGDRYAFAEFMRRQEVWVRSAIYAVLGRTDGIDDVSQNVWTTVWQRIGELRDTRSWRSWLYRLARNAALDAGREKTRRRNRQPIVGLDSAEPGCRAGPDELATRDEKSGMVFRAIQSLPGIYREPFVLRHMNDWTYRQISDVMGLPVDTVETRLVRARRLLREVLIERIGQDHVTGE